MSVLLKSSPQGGSVVSVSKSVMAKVRALQDQAKDRPSSSGAFVKKVGFFFDPAIFFRKNLTKLHPSTFSPKSGKNKEHHMLFQSTQFFRRAARCPSWATRRRRWWPKPSRAGPPWPRPWRWRWSRSSCDKSEWLGG